MRQFISLISILGLISLVQSECTAPSLPFVLRRIFYSYAYEESWKIFQGTDITGTLVHEGAGTTSDDYVSKDYDVCLQLDTIYTLAMYDSYGDGWYDGVYLSINYNDITFLTTTLNNGETAANVPKLQQFTLKMAVAPGTTWKTSTTAQTGTSWTQLSFTDTTWTSHAHGSFPSISTTTRYYRYTTTLVDTAAYALRLSVKTNSGFIVYVNGIEASRVGLPAVSNSNTASLTSETDATWKIVAIPLSVYITSGTDFTIAIEVHSHSSQLTTADVFDAYATTVSSIDGEVILFGATATCSVESSNTNDICSNVVDYSDDTKYTFPGNTGTITIALPNGSKIWFNAYQITFAHDHYKRDPKEWKLYGSEDDGVTWIFLDYIPEFFRSSTNTRYNTFNIPSNRKSFNQIKLDILSNYNGDSYTQLAEIRTFVNSQPLVDPGLQYASNTINTYTYIYVSVTPISTGIHTFTVTPDLPTGLALNPDTGVISGCLDFAVTSQEYVISAIDAATNAATSFTMTITAIVCEQPTMAQVMIYRSYYSSKNNERAIVYYEDNTQIGTVPEYHGHESDGLNGCLVAGRWKFVLFSDNNKGWEKGNYVRVYLIYDSYKWFTIAELYLHSGTTATYYVNTRLDLAPRSGWKYLAASAIDPNWYSTTFSDSTWDTIITDTVSNIATRIVLLRKSFTIISKTNMKGWEFMFISRAGIVIYVNGNEVYRYNLADGPITTDTTATDGDDYEFWTSVSGKLSTLSNGNSVNIAVARINIDTETYDLVFDGLFHLTADSSFQQEMTARDLYTTSNDLDGYAENLFDGDINTRWITELHDSITPHYFTVTYYFNRAELFDKYCIVSSFDSPQYDPADWVVSGSMDGTTFTDLSTVSNAFWKDRLERKCFYMPNNNKAYITYKWTITKAAVIQENNRYAASEIKFYLEDIESIVIPDFRFTTSIIVAYKGVTVPTLLVSSEYYYDFTISPALPTGITMDSSNGNLSGIPTQLQSTTTYTISAKNIHGIAVTTTITFSVSICAVANTAFILKFDFEEDAGEASWTLKDASGTVIDTRTTSINHSTQYFSFCKPKGIYSLVLSDSMNEGWGSGSYTILDIDNNVYVTGTVGAGESPKTVNVYIDQATGSSTSWKYLTFGTDVPSGWYTISFSDTAWSTGISGSFPALTGISQYYRTTLSITSIDASYAGYEIGVKGYAGIAVYLNGQEIIRSNLPSGTLSSSTLATSELSNWIFFKISISLIINILLNVGNNVLAVELHKKDTLPSINDFTYFTSFIPSGEYRVTDGVAWSDIEKTGDEGTDMLFDNNVDTSVVSGPRCVGAIYQYTFNNGRKEFINHYKITNGNTCNQRTPSSWRIEGSNDNGITWTLLDYEHQQFFTSYKQTFSYDFYASQPYNSYRFIATECDNTPLDRNTCGDGYFQLSEFGLYINNKAVSCVSDGIWGPAVESGYSFQECPTGSTGIQRRLCTAGVFGEIQQLCSVAAPTRPSYIGSPFTYHKNIIVSLSPILSDIESTYTIDPALPNGLTINASTGVISGTPLANSDITTYTITATNAGGSVSTTIVIYVDFVFCTSEDNWPLTEIGQQYDLPCEDPINYEGSRTRSCQVGYPAIWGSVVNNCQLRMPTIIYTVPTTIGYKNVPITPITALITGSNLNLFTIDPPLPDGLLFNSITGTIYGTPTTASSAVYTITISNPRGQSTATTTITINAFNCPIDDIWPATEVGEQASIDCEDTINYEGSRNRLCKVGDPAVWGDVVDNCQLKTPSISYTTTTITGYKNIAITAIDATITGGSLNPITISPPLPTGLTLNTLNGQIYGTPSIDSSSSYTITISNPRGYFTVSITIIISIANCIADDIWAVTEIGQQTTLDCEDPINYEGSRTRLCQLGYPAVWGSVINNCQLKIPSITYDITTITCYKNIAITAIDATITGGNLNPLTISPPLPDGLLFNTQNGQIYGTPTINSSSSYTITISNTRGTVTTNIVININIASCVAENGWSMTEIGQQVTLPCEDPINYEGSRSRVCKLGYPAVWDTVVDNCQPKLPTIIYTTTTIIGYKGIAITAIDATITGGNLNPLTINPSLPCGLSFNTVNGQIYGTPTFAFSDSYVITVSNALGQSSVTITISISVANCLADTIWPITEIGQQVTLPCEDTINYEGFRTKLCKVGYPAVWDTVINNCQLKMPSISYNSNTIIGYKDDIITPAFATITGGGLNPLTISPSLPDGLSFNTQNGFIYGIPTSASSNSYTITASNARGEATFTITITISAVNCPSDDVWPITERGITAYIECGSGQSGIQSRVCQNTGVGTASWQVADSSECYIFIVNEDPGENKVFITVPMRLEGLSESVFNTPSTIETFRILIIQSLSVYSIPSSGVKIISVSSDSSSTSGVSVSIRITANKSDEDNIKNDISILFTGIDSILLKLFKTSDDSNLKTITGISINGKIVSTGNSISVITIILIIVIIILIILIILVFILKKKKDEKEEKKEKKLQPHKTIEVETVKVEKPVIL
ncbi:hypothetical protein WA158_001255 [Blastocystis sp. Blastoise]